MATKHRALLHGMGYTVTYCIISVNKSYGIGHYCHRVRWVEEGQHAEKKALPEKSLDDVCKYVVQLGKGEAPAASFPCPWRTRHGQEQL